MINKDKKLIKIRYLSIKKDYIYAILDVSNLVYSMNH